MIGITQLSFLIFSATILFILASNIILPFGKVRYWETLEKVYPEINPTEATKARNNHISFFILPIIAFAAMSELARNGYLNSIYPFVCLSLNTMLALDGINSLSSGIYESHISSFYDKDRKYVWVAKSRIVVAIAASISLLLLIFWDFWQRSL